MISLEVADFVFWPHSLTSKAVVVVGMVMCEGSVRSKIPNSSPSNPRPSEFDCSKIEGTTVNDSRTSYTPSCFSLPPAFAPPIPALCPTWNPNPGEYQGSTVVRRVNFLSPGLSMAMLAAASRVSSLSSSSPDLWTFVSVKLSRVGAERRIVAEKSFCK